MQVEIDVTYMHTSFGERDLSGFRESISCCFEPWTKIYSEIQIIDKRELIKRHTGVREGEKQRGIRESNS